MDEVFMAIEAGVLGDFTIPRLDLNRIVVIAKREGERMEKAVVRFRHVFAYEIVRQVTVVADGHMMMAAMLPGVVVFLHHVAVRTALGIVAEIAGPFAVAKRERANSRQQAKHEAKSDCSARQPGKAFRFLCGRLRLVRGYWGLVWHSISLVCWQVNWTKAGNLLRKSARSTQEWQAILSLNFP